MTRNSMANNYKIPFNKPAVVPRSTEYVNDVLLNRPTSGNGYYTHLCHSFFDKKYGFKHSFLTTSCTDALEMSAILLDLTPQDEVIMPSYTFVSTANAFALRDAKIVFADCENSNPNVDVNDIRKKINARTKAIVVVHYAGFACDMYEIKRLCDEHNIFLIEDAAHAIDSMYDGKYLGTFGDLACFSFHETKNISCGEGGLLVVNNQNLVQRAETVWEKGTDRSAFSKGLVEKYQWVSLGSSFLPSEITAAYLLSQLEFINQIQKKRIELWKHYYKRLKDANLNSIQLPFIPEYTTVNGHLFYIIANTKELRSDIIKVLDTNGILAVFHYVSLHSSEYFLQENDLQSLPNSDKYAERLLRLPLYYNLDVTDVDLICDLVIEQCR